MADPDDVDPTKIDPAALQVGAVLQHTNGDVVVLRARKDDGTGWWLYGIGGLDDRAIAGASWRVAAPSVTQLVQERNVYGHLLERLVANAGMEDFVVDVIDTARRALADFQPGATGD